MNGKWLCLVLQLENGDEAVILICLTPYRLKELLFVLSVLAEPNCCTKKESTLTGTGE